MRDHSLDLLKGLACILMIFAHSRGVDVSPLTSILYGENDRLTHLIYMMGEAAPIIFFPIVGVTAYMQANKYRPKPVLISFVFLFLLGFSYNGITQRDFYSDFQLEMIQIIAIGAFLVYIIQYTKKPAPATFLVIGLTVFALKILGSHNPWLRELLTFKPGIILPPGPFPLLPWLFLFFLGAFAYNTNNINNLILAGVSIGLFITLKLLSFPLQPGNKWDMSVGYFLLSCFLLFSSFYIVRKFAFFRSEDRKQLVLYLGKFSLLFLFVHKFVIRLLHNLAVWPVPYLVLHRPFVFWFTVLVMTVILMKLILDISAVDVVNRIFQNIWAWVLLAILILLVPTLTKNSIVIYSLELILGIIFAVYYPLLGKAIKQPGTLAVQPKVSQLS